MICDVCPRRCSIAEGKRGFCKARGNRDGRNISLSYGKLTSIALDPIEKKPLYHFLPGSQAFSIATAGCNFACMNCQNWEISQTSPRKTRNIVLFPEQVVEQCLLSGSKAIAYTYSEPTSFYEYMFDTAVIAHRRGVRNVLVSNGYINDKPLRTLASYLDAANIDLKSFSNDIYLKLSAGTLQPVLNTLKTLNEMGVWLEITNLVVPSWTDDLDMIGRMCGWLAENGFTENPLHFSRFFPLYKLTQLPQTPVSTLIKARDIALKAGLKHVYIGNVPGLDASNTLCPSCGRVVVERKGFSIYSINLKNGKCANCGSRVKGVWE